MVVSEMIEWLKTMPQDAVVMCVYHSSGHTYYDQGGNVEWKSFDPSPPTPENNYLQDFELYTYPDGKTTLQIGSTGN